VEVGRICGVSVGFVDPGLWAINVAWMSVSPCRLSVMGTIEGWDREFSEDLSGRDPIGPLMRFGVSRDWEAIQSLRAGDRPRGFESGR
jgi:hypothetical protein